MPDRRELLATTIPPAVRHQTIFETFDALEEGDSFVLVNDHYPKPLLYQFQAERAGMFEWNVLEASPSRYRVEILRRDEVGPRTVSECLEVDHRRLDAIVEEVEAKVDDGDFGAARALFAEFVCGLDRHIDFEEEILFSYFEGKTGMRGAGPTVVMRQEHVQIREKMAAVTRALVAEKQEDFSWALRELVDVLGAHNQKEEGMLYPMTDTEAGSERERDDLVRRLQAF